MLKVVQLSFIFTLKAYAGFTFPLNFFVVDQTQWTDSEVNMHIKNVERIFSVCNLRPEPIQVNIIPPPFGYTEFSAPKDQEIATIIPQNLRPALFFTDGADTPQAYGADEFAEGSPRAILSNTAWFSRIIKTPQYLANLNPNYDPVAMKSRIYSVIAGI